MKKNKPLLVVGLVVLLGMAFVSLAHGNGPKYKFDEDGTPLAKALESEFNEQQKTTPPTPSRGKKFKSVKVKKGCNPKNKACTVDVEVVCEDCGDIVDKSNNLIARKKRSQLDIEYDYEDTANPTRLRLRIPGQAPPSNEDEAGLVDRDSSLSYTRFGPSFDGKAPADVDCVDLVTGSKVKNDLCFDDQGLRENLETITGTDEEPIRRCLHQDPKDYSITEVIYEPEQNPAVDGICFDENGVFKKTSLAPLIAEKEIYGEALCMDMALNTQKFGINPKHVDYVEEDGAAYCDFTRAYMVDANLKDIAAGNDPRYLIDESGEANLFEPANPPKDENGKPKEGYKNAKRFGEYTRKATIREDVTLKCRGNKQLIDDKCWDIDSAARNAQLAPSLSAGIEAFLADYPARTEESGMLMGFTWAPPVEEWGYSVYEEECLLGVCVELLDARIGYKFDVAAGLRFPIDVTMNDLPPINNLTGETVIAESEVRINTSVEPKDWTVGDFKKYCNDNKLPYDCEDRFAFPEFFDNFFNELAEPLGLKKPANSVDGSEAVARADIFIGGKLEVLGIELLGLYLGADVDIMTACTASKLRSWYTEEGFSVDNAVSYEALSDIFGGENVAKSLGLICGSFATPFGADDGFDLAEFTIPASCDGAQKIPFTKTSTKPSKKLCSKLELEKKGAKLGIDLSLGFGLTGRKINSQATVSLDGCKQSAVRQDAAGQISCSGNSKALAWTPDDLDEEFVVNADNFNNGQNIGKITLSNFSLELVPTVTIGAALNFGGVLDLIPNIGLDLYTLVLEEPRLSISQHDEEVVISENFFVRNYALEVDGKPVETCAPDGYCTNVEDDDTLLIKPGKTGSYEVKVKNLGSVAGDFDNFRYDLSNRPAQAEPFTFIINPNTDFDCIDANGDHQRGYPYDGISDLCYTAEGTVQPGATELIDEDGPGPEDVLFSERDSDGDGLADEDPAENWQAGFGESLFIAGVSPNTLSSKAGNLSITPFRHPLTKPGRYPVQILADSVEAKSNGLAGVDPVGQSRVNAEDVIFIQIDAFFDPLVAAAPLTESGKPGIGKAYIVEVSNGSNVTDSIVVDTDRVNSNLAGCSLTTLGADAGCPFRASPTVIAENWTNGNLPTPTGPLEPLHLKSNQFTVDVPSDWAGMVDTSYHVVFSVTSTADPESPAASKNVRIEQTVTATMESMTRYIGLELAELIGVITQANASGIATAGLEPIEVQAVQRTNNRALSSILQGNLSGASRSHAANIKIMQGFTRALAGSGKKLPAWLFDDLNARASAIIADLTTAQSSLIPSN